MQIIQKDKITTPDEEKVWDVTKGVQQSYNRNCLTGRSFALAETSVYSS